jgi:hypothetical protein
VGRTGNGGKTGDIGETPKHQWQGSALRFQKPDETWGKYVELRGLPGQGGGGAAGGAILNGRLKALSKGPESLSFTYNVDKTVSNIAGARTDIDFTYNGDKTVNTIDNQIDLFTYSYNVDKTVDQITVS